MKTLLLFVFSRQIFKKKMKKIALLLSVLFVVFSLAERSLNHAGSQHYLRIQHATTPKFVSLEYPRADGTILIAELSCNDGVLSAN